MTGETRGNRESPDRETREERESPDARAGSDRGERPASGSDPHPLFLPLIFGGGLLFGLGLGVSRMAHPEVVLDFLQFDDLGLLFVMGGAAGVTGLAVVAATRFGDRAPLTGDAYRRRLRSLDRNVVVGGSIFGIGWGVSGTCPGAAYASLGIGNLPILWAVAGMFVGAYLQGWLRSRAVADADASATAD